MTVSTAAAGGPSGMAERCDVAEIVSLYGTTPAEIFESGLENIAEIEAVAVTVLWKDGRITAGWSNVDLGNLARMLLVLDEEQRRKTLRGEAG